ncbi:MAG: hypothetical protein Q8877_02715, partial [Sweet potato little leaf phytoplasma]|nr:hypothetical protein [Sweet potato little leaf phytoplasma]
MPYKLAVSTPTSASVVTSLVCLDCSLKVLEREFQISLICLPLKGLDIILGMDWMSVNRVVIDCHKKAVIFPPLTLATLELEEEPNVCDIPVVQEFPEVFPDDIPGLPPQREVEF